MNLASHRADVLIIGAGPAGSVAGALLAQAGFHVITLEAGTFPRFQIGESLLPRCNDLLEEAGLLGAVQARGYLRKGAALFLRGEESERFSFEQMFPGQQPATFQVPRADFDQTLATAARGKGVDVRFNMRVDTVEAGAEGVSVNATDLESAATVRFEARFILDCSGYGRVLARLFKLETAPTLEPQVALFNWVEGDVRPEGEQEGDIWICCHPQGPWEWVIPFSNGRTSLGIVLNRAHYDRLEGCDRDRYWTLIQQDPNVRRRMEKATPVLKTQKLSAWSAGVERLQGPGWAVTGNAAEFLDPIFSSGVTLALESASLAVKALTRQLRGETVDWDTDYEHVVRKASHVFKVFVETWYTGELPTLMLRTGKSVSIKRAITAILGGYVLDEENPFVRDPAGTLSALMRMS